jgi:putative tricarboxylic transport membrane protein
LSNTENNNLTTEAHESPSAVSTKTVELIVAGTLFLIAAVVIFDSVRLGFRWGDDGPQAGYFPFYIAMMLAVSSLVIGWRAARKVDVASFVSRGELRLVFSVLLPLVVYVVLVGFLGLYVPSIIFIAYFMLTQGKYGWLMTAAVSVGVMALIFVVFEYWFQVPLLKGPIETLLRLA